MHKVAEQGILTILRCLVPQHIRTVFLAHLIRQIHQCGRIQRTGAASLPVRIVLAGPFPRLDQLGRYDALEYMLGIGGRGSMDIASYRLDMHRIGNLPLETLARLQENRSVVQFLGSSLMIRVIGTSLPYIGIRQIRCGPV